MLPIHPARSAARRMLAARSTTYTRSASPGSVHHQRRGARCAPPSKHPERSVSRVVRAWRELMKAYIHSHYHKKVNCLQSTTVVCDGHRVLHNGYMELDKYSRIGIALLVFFLFAATLYCGYTYLVSSDTYHFQAAASYDGTEYLNQ